MGSYKINKIGTGTNKPKHIKICNDCGTKIDGYRIEVDNKIVCINCVVSAYCRMKNGLIGWIAALLFGKRVSYFRDIPTPKRKAAVIKPPIFDGGPGAFDMPDHDEMSDIDPPGQQPGASDLPYDERSDIGDHGNTEKLQDKIADRIITEVLEDKGNDGNGTPETGMEQQTRVAGEILKEDNRSDVDKGVGLGILEPVNKEQFPAEDTVMPDSLPQDEPDKIPDQTFNDDSGPM